MVYYKRQSPKLQVLSNIPIKVKCPLELILSELTTYHSSLTTFNTPGGLKLTGLPTISCVESQLSNDNVRCGGGDAFPLPLEPILVCGLDAELKNGVVDPADVLALLELAPVIDSAMLVAVENPDGGGSIACSGWITPDSLMNPDGEGVPMSP